MIKLIIFAFLMHQCLTVDIDPNTFSNYLDVRMNHLHVEWLLDLDKKIVNGTAQISFKFLKHTNYIDLDVYQLSILNVYLLNGNTLKHEIQVVKEQSLIQGDRLHIQLDRDYNPLENIILKIKYAYDERARAVGFLTKEQTYSKKVPYMFTQCESNNCRSIIPLQDTPSVKFTFTATVISTNPLIKAFMTGEQIASLPLIGQYGLESTFYTYSFQLNIPIPAYLIGIVAGEIEQKHIGANCYVISEPFYLDDYAKELEELPFFIEKMTDYIGPYIWGDYKIVILPSSFPFGGMEHPLLTFASPVIIVGDKSGVGTAVHEIAHSWMGNTVTGNNWSNMWIMEGFCVFLERKTYKYVRPQDYDIIEAINGNFNLISAIQGFTDPDEKSYQTLHPITSWKNPDDSTSSVPYERGYQLLYYLEQLIGEENFKFMLRQYLDHFKFQSIDEDDFYKFLLDWVRTNVKVNTQKIIDEIVAVYKPWVYQQGLPPKTIEFKTPKYDEAVALANKWITQGKPNNADDYIDYMPNQKMIFMQQILDNYAKLTHQRLKELDDYYKLSGTKSGPKIAFKWYKTVILCKYDPGLDAVHAFLQSLGVRSYVVGTYEVLIPNYPNQAEAWFAQDKWLYHPLVANRVEDMLKKKIKSAHITQ
ncbi:unnamed protein product [Paramecium octaurelia]|uniref:Peptidase M1 leukotriene A4 hydrolase/aminopeptidase C-terminal domain-containing protein n=1 Tax=Paramecium octaurelia TaxID=43137 RepID=A0A8S1TE95_PAROT|nr:unnamed protein product [Paramecium octaurelia]